jgi:hypothetical protein
MRPNRRRTISPSADARTVGDHRASRRRVFQSCRRRMRRPRRAHDRLHCPANPSGSSRAPTISRELGGPKKSYRSVSRTWPAPLLIRPPKPHLALASWAEPKHALPGIRVDRRCGHGRLRRRMRKIRPVAQWLRPRMRGSLKEPDPATRSIEEAGHETQQRPGGLGSRLVWATRS